MFKTKRLFYKYLHINREKNENREKNTVFCFKQMRLKIIQGAYD